LKRRRKTAGELSLKALSDINQYDGREVAEAQMHDIYEQLTLCANKHDSIFDEEEFFVGMIRASDPLIKGIVRQKYFAMLYMPSPRPEQAVFLYKKKNQSFKFLWSLPPAKVMAAISEAQVVAKKWQRTKAWCDAFFAGNFWNHIRKENKFDHLSEIEYLKVNREKLIQAGCQEGPPRSTDAFDFAKITTNQVIDSDTTIRD
jgi:hypothetical protein